MHAQDVLFYGHRSLMRALDALDHAYWGTPGVCGVWTAKDVVAHLASYEIMLSEVLGSFLDLDDTPTLNRYRDGENANDAEVEARAGMSVDQVLAEYEAARQLVDTRIKQIPETTLRETGALPWYGEEYDLEDYIVYVGYGHKREHAAQFNSYKDCLHAAS